MAKFLGILAALGVIVTASAASAGPNLIQNGDFETASFAPWVTAGLVSTTTMIPYFGGGSAVANGTTMVTFNDGDRTANGSIYQSFGTIAGNRYALSFDYGTNNDVVQHLMTEIADSNGVIAATIIASPAASGTLGTYGLLFTATSAMTTLTFIDDPTNFTFSTDGLLDNVVVSSVPEPTSFVLVLTGAGLIGAGRQRRGRPAY